MSDEAGRSAPRGSRKAVFLGSKALGLRLFSALHAQDAGLDWTIIHPDDRDDARSVLGAFQDCARERGVDVHLSASAAATKQLLRDLSCELGVVCGWYAILDAEALACVPGGLWGVHNSLLPAYRGGSPLVWSIIRGDAVVGSSVFRLSEGMDTGEILLQVSVSNTLSDTVQSLLDKIERALVAELPARWRALLAGEAELAPQDEHQATYCGQRVEDDGLIDWQLPAVDVHNFIRAQSPPYPGAFTYLMQDEIRILRSQPTGLVYDGTPGQVLRRNAHSVLVACGQRTALEVLEVSVAGIVATPAAVFRSIRLRCGQRRQPTAG